MDDPATRPDMMVADFFVEAANDIHYEYISYQSQLSVPICLPSSCVAPTSQATPASNCQGP
jgi:hypothetical protein